MPIIAANFTLGARNPIDDRQVVDTYADLDTLLVYEGLIVYVTADAKVYVCYETYEAQDPTDSTKTKILGRWKEIPSGQDVVSLPEVDEENETLIWK